MSTDLFSFELDVEGFSKFCCSRSLLNILISFKFVGIGKKTLRLGAIPTVNLPIKSHATRKSPEQRHKYCSG